MVYKWHFSCQLGDGKCYLPTVPPFRGTISTTIEQQFWGLTPQKVHSLSTFSVDGPCLFSVLINLRTMERCVASHLKGTQVRSTFQASRWLCLPMLFFNPACVIFFPSHRPIGFFISKVFFFQLTSDTITHHQLQVDTVFFWGVCTYQSEYATLCLSQSFNFPLNNPTGWVADTLLRWPLKWETTSCCLSAWVLGQ